MGGFVHYKIDCYSCYDQNITVYEFNYINMKNGIRREA